MTTKNFFVSGTCLKQGMMAIAIVLSSISFTACSDDDDKNAPETEVTAKTVTFEAQSYTEWTYFSFAKGDFVTVDQENYASDMNWDIAFLRFNIRTNGGESGKGQGAVLDTKETDLNKVTSIPSTGFITDSKISVMASGGMPPKYVETAGSPVFKVGENQGWAFYNYMASTWSYNNNVFIVRTADGLYAKLIMKSFLNDEDKSGHITFEYVYPFK
ncbi:HmuY family protein [Parabacteroides sp.]